MKCEYIHFSVHNMFTKLVDDKHEKWPGLLGTVVLAYNATIHSATGYSPTSYSSHLPLPVSWMPW